MKKGTFTTQEVADAVGIDKSTLLRWIKKGEVSDSIHRDGRNWRVWTQKEVDSIITHKRKKTQLNIKF